MAADFYVYEHARGDTCAVFYVGKGSGDRCKSKQGRNKWWRNIVQKVGPPTIRIVARGLDEDLAHLVEMERIDQHRLLGTRLTNMTDGGEGMSGYKCSAESIQKRVAKVKGRPNIGASLALKGVPKSEEHRRKLSESRFGKPLSDAAKAAMATRRKRPRRQTQKEMFLRFGRQDSEATRQKKSAARRGQLNPRFGVQIPEEQKARQIVALKARPRVACPHCEKTMDESNAKRWHFDNCKEKS